MDQCLQYATARALSRTATAARPTPQPSYRPINVRRGPGPMAGQRVYIPRSACLPT
jgi:hypothetical protein